ncbi:MAG: glycosyltransferase family 2 protein [Acidimicrobiales bacterium]
MTPDQPPARGAGTGTARHQQNGAVEPADAASDAVADEVAPPVVVVLVTHDPGAWFDETLASVAAQSYPNLTVLVVDAASTVDPEPRVAAALPAAHLRRVDGNPGFGPACNTVLGAVEGAAFYLFCHDDVRLDPDAITRLVEEAYRANAGIVGPKLVDWHRPDRLLAIGMGADKAGCPAPLVDRGELDQQQHDAVSDVFFIPGAATLVRADLFEALGGFDDEIDLLGEDLDLCWRAHAAGARVVAAPAARVAHLEALGVRRPLDDRRRLQMRHRLRAVQTDYGRWNRMRVVPQATVLAAVEILYSIVLGRFRQARDVFGAWPWNLRRHGSMRAKRKALKAVRQVPDREVRRLQVRGSARLSAYLRGQIGDEGDRLGAMVASSRDLAAGVRSGRPSSVVVTWLVVLAVWAFGTRTLLTHGVPTVGWFAALPGSVGDLFRSALSGYQEVGIGSIGPAPTLLGALGLWGIPFLGATGVLRSAALLALLPLGAIGAWRLARPIGSRRAKIVALVAYLAVPVPYNAMAQGRLPGLVLYAVAPWVLAHLARASRVAPFGDLGGEGNVPDRPLLQHVLVVGVLGAMAVAVTPSAAVVLVGMAVALVVGGLLVGQLAGAARILATAVGGVVVAAVLLVPWSLTLATGEWRAAWGAMPGTGPLPLGDVVRGHSGPFGGSPIEYAVPVAAALGLLIGRRWRLAWAVRGWAVALAGWAVVWVAGQGWLPASLPLASPEVLLAPAAAGLALAVAMAMAAFEVDLPGYNFGWRQVASLVAAVALALAVVPVLARSVDGSWGMPEGDAVRAVENLTARTDGPFRILWVGDADVVPLHGWRLDAPDVAPDQGGQLVYGTSANGGPTVDDLFPGGDDATAAHLGRALRSAGAGGTTRLGSQLAPMGIRYVIVPDRLAPAPYVTDPTSPQPRLEAMLEGQLDLTRVEVVPGLAVYRNAAWGPTRALLPSDAPIPAGGPKPVDNAVPDLAGAPAALPSTNGPSSFSGSIDRPTQVYLGAPSADEWQLDVGGSSPPRREVLGWSQAWTVSATGSATLSYRTSPLLDVVVVGGAVLWAFTLVFLLRTRVTRDERRVLVAASGAPPAADLRSTPTPEPAAGPAAEPDPGPATRRRRGGRRRDAEEPVA